MDIKAAFPSLGRVRLVHTMKGKGIDGDLIRWTARFLSDRTFKMVSEGNVMERRAVDAEIAPCSPVSPIIFAISTSGLISWVEERGSRI
jgi:hypothetical protein